MTASTVEYWDIDGVSLNEFGWNIRTVGGARYDLPPLRGGDIQYAYVPGSQFRPKLPDSKVVTLAMWVTGVDPVTGLTVADTTRRWNDSWHFLRKLFWQPSRQFILTRRWLLSDSNGNPTVVTASALGQLASTMEPTMTGRHRAEFTVDILLTDPFFYGTQVTTNLVVHTPGLIHNPGDYLAAHRYVTAQIVGPLTNPSLTNATSDPDVAVILNTTVDAGETVTLDMQAFTAISDRVRVDASGDGSFNRIGYLAHHGARQWFGLAPGDNAVTLDAAGGTGHAVLTFRPPYV